MSRLITVIKSAQIAANSTGKRAYILSRKNGYKWQFTHTKRDKVVEIIRPIGTDYADTIF